MSQVILIAVIVAFVVIASLAWQHHCNVLAERAHEAQSRRRVKAEFARIRADRPEYIVGISRELMGDDR